MVVFAPSVFRDKLLDIEKDYELVVSEFDRVKAQNLVLNAENKVLRGRQRSDDDDCAARLASPNRESAAPVPPDEVPLSMDEIAPRLEPACDPAREDNSEKSMTLMEVPLERTEDDSLFPTVPLWTSHGSAANSASVASTARVTQERPRRQSSFSLASESSRRHTSALEALQDSEVVDQRFSARSASSDTVDTPVPMQTPSTYRGTSTGSLHCNVDINSLEARLPVHLPGSRRNSFGEEPLTLLPHWDVDAEKTPSRSRSSSFPKTCSTSGRSIRSMGPQTFRAARYARTDSSLEKWLHFGFEIDLQCAASVLCLHPNGILRLTWLIFCAIFLVYDLIVIPLGAFGVRPEDSSVLKNIQWVMGAFWAVDILVNFFTGYYDHGILVMSLRRISIHYMKTWLLIDLILTCMDWLYMLESKEEAKNIGFTRVMRNFRMCRLMRLWKSNQLWVWLHELVQSMWMQLSMGILKMLVCLLMLSHLIACTWFAIGKDGWVISEQKTSATLADRYTTSLHWALTQFTPASSALEPVNAAERSFTLFVIVFGVIIFSTIISNITRVVLQFSRLSETQMEQTLMLRRFLRERRVSRVLTARIYQFLSHVQSEAARRCQVQEAEVELLALLSIQLREELRCELFLPGISIHPLLRWIHKSSDMTMIRLCTRAVSQRRLASRDALFFWNEEGEHMYILVEGGMNYIKRDEEGMTVNTIDVPDRTCLSELALWITWQHGGDLFAKKQCELLTLSAKEFRVVIGMNPLMYDQVIKLAQTILVRLNAEPRAELDDFKCAAVSEQGWRPSRGGRPKLERKGEGRFLGVGGSMDSLDDLMPTAVPDMPGLHLVLGAADARENPHPQARRKPDQ